MVLGACTCVTQNCQNTLSVSGCGGASTDDYFCDGSKLYYGISSYVYKQAGDKNCGAIGGPTSVSCSCSPRQLISIPAYSPPSPAVSGGFWPGKPGPEDHPEYDNTALTGPCMCDLMLSELTGPQQVYDRRILGYNSIGDNSKAAYCAGGQNTIILDRPGGTGLLRCGYNSTAYGLSLKAFTHCRCVPSGGSYGANQLAASPVAGVAPIASRVAALGTGSPVQSSSTSRASTSSSTSGTTSASLPTRSSHAFARADMASGQVTFFAAFLITSLLFMKGIL